jgi:lipopolysaccharide export system ATP-binding protein
MAILQTAELSKSYRGRRVVNGVSLKVAQGEVVGLLGPNGAGKTTSFHMIVGLIQPDAGQVLLDDRDITSLPMYQRARLGISYLPQEASVFRKLTVEENIMAILQTVKWPRGDRRDRLDSLIGEMGLETVRKSRGYQLSGGERRRVEIARSLVIAPSFLLLDEPFSGIDPKQVLELQKIISKLKQSGIGILVTDHNVRETLSVTDRAYIIHNGQVFRAGPPRELESDPEVRRVYLGESFSFEGRPAAREEETISEKARVKAIEGP